MATESNNTTAAAPAVTSISALTLWDKARVKTFREALKEREIFSTLAEALAKLDKAADLTTPKAADGTAEEGAIPFYGVPVAITGSNDEGEIDESVYAGKLVALAYMGTKDSDKGTGVRAIVIYPIPTLDDFFAAEEGKAMIQKVMEKECSLVAFRRFRDAVSIRELNEGVNAIPRTVEEYTTESNTGIDTEAFDNLYPGFKKSIESLDADMAKNLPPKNMLRDAIRSKAFAMEEPRTVEFEKANLIIVFAKMMLAAAPGVKDAKGQPAPIDAGAIQTWLDGRDEFVFPNRKPVERDFSGLADLAAKLGAL